MCIILLPRSDFLSLQEWRGNVKQTKGSGKRWADPLAGLTEMLCDVAVMLIVIVCDWRSAQTGHCARDGKSVLDRINQLTCVGFCLLWTVETKTTLRGQWMGRDGPLPVIWHHIASIYNSLRQTGARPAWPRCTLKGTWACMCWHRCECLDLLTAELCDLLTPGSPAKWHLKIPSRKRVKNAIWH